ncbi:transcriptional antiterminator [Edwardsiella piscicida]|nr:CAT RNA binding domain-containing protein [Edwardsiella piscicida]ARD19943.1 transcriptional antiterminator [Edwardsiella piscicida]WLJ48125.1 CAT RNA binding domain-containing protein [Edwardsiella piscicida]
MMMRIAKILNNNVVLVLALDSRQRELVMMGRGLAFHQCVGDILDEGRIEKIFALQCNRLSCRPHNMILHLPLDAIATCERIILSVYTGQGKLQAGLASALAEYCYCAIERHRRGAVIHNALLREIIGRYPREFALGLQVKSLITQYFSLALSHDEVGFIALHFVMARLNSHGATGH